MSAPVTEAHLRLANQLVSSPPSPLVLATLIADSEARACAELRADRDYNHECINRLATATGTLGEKSERVVEVALSTIDQLRPELKKAIARAEAELAAERARLDWLECHGWITGEPCDRAAIDAAMKEDKA